jgi:hypothetical protein
LKPSLLLTTRGVDGEHGTSSASSLSVFLGSADPVHCCEPCDIINNTTGKITC